MIKVVADNKIPFLKGALEPLAEVIYLPGNKITREDLIDADALIVRTRTLCNESLLEGTAVKFIATATIGYDHIDTDYCHAKGIEWTNAPGCNSGSVKQYIGSALATILKTTCKSFSELTLGIVGVGNVGAKVESLARSLGLEVLLNDPPRERREGSNRFVALDTLVKESDIITMHVPFTRQGDDATWHMVNENFLMQMKKGSWFINSSRGEVASTTALIKALESKHLAGAIIDVWENEPHIDLNLMNIVDIATPHIAGYSTDGKANGTAMSVQALSRHFKLDMDDWYPETIPPAPVHLHEISAMGKSAEEVFTEISLKTYDIEADSNRLRTSPETFEEQRGAYPIRREPENLSVRIIDDNNNYRDMLNKIGYQIVNV